MAVATGTKRRSLRCRRNPCVRDEVLDHGGAARPRIAVTLMLPSAASTASASARRLSRLNSSPHTIAVYASRWSSPSTPQHSLPGGPYPLPALVFPQLDRASLP